MAHWKGTAQPGRLPGFLSIAIFSDPKVVSESTRNMRQSLVNFSAGLTDASRIRIGKREKTEIMTFNGIEFSRFKWSGSAPDGSVAQGLVYGATHNQKSIMISAINIGADAENENKKLEAAIATFKKR